MPFYVNPNTSFYDKSFKSTNFASCVLNIHLGMHGVNLAVFDSEKNKFIGFESFRIVGAKNENNISDELASLIKERDWLKNNFKKVNVIFSNPQTTLIPQALFNEEKKDLYLGFNQPLLQQSITDYNLLKNAGLATIFSIPKTLAEKIKSIWPDSVLYHSSSVLIESILINYRNKTNNNILFVQLNHNYFELVYIKHNKLHFHNTFIIKSKEDFIYFLLASIEKLKLNPEDVNIVLSGFIDKSSIYYEMVLQYIRNSDFIDRNETFKYSFPLDNLMHHKYYVLFNILQCE